MKCIEWEYFASKVCTQSECGSCGHMTEDAGGADVCRTMCNGAISGLVPADDLTERDIRLLGGLFYKGEQIA